MDREELEGILNSVLESFDSDDVAEPNSAKVTENLSAVSDIVSTLEIATADGIDWEDITVIGKVIEPIMVLASGFDGFGGNEKRNFVCELVWLIYKTIDGYPGGKNNINIPWLIGPLERKFERAVIKFAGGMAVDALFKRLRDAGEV